MEDTSAILRYWQAVEAFSFIPFPPRSKRSIFQERSNSLPPWKSDAPVRKSLNGKVEIHMVYVGILKVNAVLEEVAQAFPNDQAFQEHAASTRGQMACLQIAMTNSGKVLPSPNGGPTVTCSGLLCAIGQFDSLKIGPPTYSYDTFQEGIRTIFTGGETDSDRWPSSRTFKPLVDALNSIVTSTGWQSKATFPEPMVRYWSGTLRPNQIEMDLGSFYLHDLSRVIRNLKDGQTSAPLSAFVGAIPERKLVSI